MNRSEELDRLIGDLMKKMARGKASSAEVSLLGKFAKEQADRMMPGIFKKRQPMKGRT